MGGKLFPMATTAPVGWSSPSTWARLPAPPPSRSQPCVREARAAGRRLGRAAASKLPAEHWNVLLWADFNLSLSLLHLSFLESGSPIAPLIPMIAAASKFLLPPPATTSCASAADHSAATSLPQMQLFGLRFRRRYRSFGVRAPTRWAACFAGLAGNGVKAVRQEATTESPSGGVDVWDADALPEQQGFPEHLVVMVNGLSGSSADWKFAAGQFVKRFPDKVIVHRSECNYSRLTFDGVDMMGERLANEVLSVVNCRPGIRKISFVAHSLGGLIARYAIGRLYEPCLDKDLRDDVNGNPDKASTSVCKIAGLQPINFITVATPHLGSRGNKQLPFLCGLPFLERSASLAAHFIVGRTGRHLFLTDNDDGKPPLLLRMVYDHDDIKFRSALGSFKRRVAYANTNFDSMVGWRTSSIRRQHELPKAKLLVNNEKYPHIVYVDNGEGETGVTESDFNTEIQKDNIEEEMINGLSQVPWERVDVSFQKSALPYSAHNTIQVRRYWINADGADVIFHMMDGFII